jgi:hypothetical protein
VTAISGGGPESRVEQWESQGEEGLLIWASLVWEKPESLKSEGLGPVQ